MCSSVLALYLKINQPFPRISCHEALKQGCKLEDIRDLKRVFRYVVRAQDLNGVSMDEGVYINDLEDGPIDETKGFIKPVFIDECIYFQGVSVKGVSKDNLAF